MQLFGGDDHEQFEIFRELHSGKAIGVASIATSFSPYSKDPSLRVI